MLKELTSRGILFICLLKGRSCTYLDVKKMTLNFKKFHSSIPFHCLYTPDVYHQRASTLIRIHCFGYAVLCL